MNDYQTTDSGLLKSDYNPGGGSALNEALKKRREKLKETKLKSDAESES